jgi:hypothetical protein
MAELRELVVARVGGTLRAAMVLDAAAPSFEPA